MSKRRRRRSQTNSPEPKTGMRLAATGRIVPVTWRDDLSRRSTIELERWLKTLSPSRRAMVRYAR